MKKIILLCFATLLATLMWTPGHAQYCAPEATNSDRYVDSFSTTAGSENISNASSGFSTAGYGDFTSLTVEQGLNGAVNFEVNIEGGNAGFRIWVDWNQDDVFDSTDEVAFQSSGYSIAHSGTFTIPANALEGETRMRIVSHWLNSSGEVDPCETGFTYGEFEDYTFNVTSTVSWDCPLLEANIGDSCDDGDPNTMNDVVNENCNCEGIIPPDGMVCDAPIEITSLPYTTTDNTENYGDDYSPADKPANAPGVIGNPSSNYLGGDDVVYSYTAVANGVVDISVTGHGTWAGVFVFTGCTPFESTVGGQTNSSASVDLEVMGLPVNAGTTYYIVISTYASPQSTDYTLNVTASVYDCPALEVNFGSACDDGNSQTYDDTVNENCECEGILYECPALEANFGDSCDDGDSNTVNDTINENCECEGISITTNDEACTATDIACGDTITQSLVGATESMEDDCFGTGSADVWFSFTSDGSQIVTVAETSPLDAVVQLFAGDECGNITEAGACDDFPEEFIVTEAGNYYLRVRPYSSSNDEGIITVNLTCEDFDCPNEQVNFGDVCDDGDPNTINDTVDENCNCLGELPAEGSVCESAIALDCNVDPVTYSSANSSGTNTTSCSMGDYGLWFTFMGTGGDITVNSSATFDHEMSINSGSCGSLVNIGCDDGSTGAEEYTISASVENETYYVYVAHYSSFTSGTGDITISIDCATPPACLTPALALEVQDASGDPIEACIEAGGEYYVLATLSGGEGNTTYNVSANSGVEIAVAAEDSQVFGPFTVGTNVSVTAVGAQDGDCDVSASINSPEVCPPSNDNCDEAIPLVCGETITGSTASATASGLSATCSGFTSSSALDVFYSFEADGTSDYTVSLDAASGNFFDGILFVYSDVCGNLTNLGCSDGGNPEEMTLIAPAAGTYTVRLFRYTGTGNYTLGLECTSAVSGYVYESGAWTPSDPNGNATASDDITVVDGEASFTSDIEVNNITVNSGATLNVESVLTINGDITNDGDMVFKSTATSDGELAAVPASSSIIGDMTVERYMSDNRSYRMISSPVTTTSSIQANWQEGATSATENPNPGYGTHITGSESGDNGFDATITGNPSLFTLNATSQAFDAVDNTNVNMLNAGEGYLIFVRGDRDIDLSSNDSHSATTLRTTGSMLTGTFTEDTNVSNIQGEFNMVANPYQSAVNINLVIADSDNLNANFAYVYDPNLGTNGAYVTVDLSDGSNSSGSAANQFLQPGQAAQVATASNATTSIIFNESAKSPNNHTTTFRSTSVTNGTFIVGQLFTAENYAAGNTLHDSFKLMFDASFDNALTNEDAIKPFNFTENMGLGSLGAVYSVERRQIPVENEQIALYTDNYEHEAYSLVLKVENLESDVTAYFVDSFTGEEVALIEGDNLINFNVNQDSEASRATDRFYISFAASLAVENVSLNSSLQLYPNPTTIEDGFYLSSSLWKNQMVDISVRDLLGRVVYSTQQMFTNGRIHVSPGNSLGNGTYFVEVNQGDQSIVKRFITK
ncbi:GEVED domain-containing protein [Mesonia ostreae]|uniref:GEVED domain-containing protein n=1 Tax=Mesonia ostreae TaxID=861110 RepID=A0ABU2KHB2_9FLAO|nr:GEVED domain-containing protein [Mesonia ostreae]MDT0294108.1 GEVED domain-containing protein [Mesonia ostreae]